MLAGCPFDALGHQGQRRDRGDPIRGGYAVDAIRPYLPDGFDLRPCGFLTIQHADFLARSPPVPDLPRRHQKMGVGVVSVVVVDGSMDGGVVPLRDRPAKRLHNDLVVWEAELVLRW